MLLESGRGVLAMEAGEADIHEAVADDRGRRGFMILSKADQVSIRAIGEGDGPYVLEYCAGDAGHRYRSLAEVTKAKVEEAFLSYLMGDGQWLHGVQWQRVGAKPWWRFW